MYYFSTLTVFKKELKFKGNFFKTYFREILCVIKRLKTLCSEALVKKRGRISKAAEIWVGAGFTNNFFCLGLGLQTISFVWCLEEPSKSSLAAVPRPLAGGFVQGSAPGCPCPNQGQSWQDLNPAARNLHCESECEQTVPESVALTKTPSEQEDTQRN